MSTLASINEFYFLSLRLTSPRSSMTKVPKTRRAFLVVSLMWIFKGSPLLSIRDDVFTVSPKRQYRGILIPTLWQRDFNKTIKCAFDLGNLHFYFCFDVFLTSDNVCYHASAARPGMQSDPDFQLFVRFVTDSERFHSLENLQRHAGDLSCMVLTW